MASYEFHPGDYNRIILRQLRFIAIVFIVVVLTGILIGKMMPERYEAKAVVETDFELFFDGAKIDPAILGSMIDNPGEMMVDITGYEVLLDVGKKLGSIPESVNVKTVMENSDALNEIGKIREMISLNPISVTRQVEIKVTSPDRQEASTVANLVSSIYKDYAYNKKITHLTVKEKRILENLKRCRMKVDSLSKQKAMIKNAAPVLVDEEFVDRKRKKTDDLARELRFKMYIKSIAATEIQHYSDVKEQLERYMKEPVYGGEHVGENIFEYMQEPGSISEIFAFDPALGKIHKRILELNDSRTRFLQYFRTAHPVIFTINKQLYDATCSLLDGLEKMCISFVRDSVISAQMTDAIFAHLSDQPEKENLFDRIKRTHSLQEQLCESIEAQLSEIQTTILGMVPYVTIVSDAAVPLTAKGLSEKKILLLAITGGVILGLLLAIFREMADRSIRTIEDMHRVVGNYSILSLIPGFKDKKHPIFRNRKKNTFAKLESCLKLPVLFDSASSCSEAFRMLGAQLRIQNTAQECAVILVTSSIHQEGKTVIAANVAIALAQQGYQALLFDGNFRSPMIASLFGVPPFPGLSDILLETSEAQAAILTVTDLLIGPYDWKSITGATGLRNLNLLTSGAAVPNPVELLGSDRMNVVIDNLRVDYDYIIIDSPPVMFTTDTQVISRYCNGTILVYRSGRAQREVLSASIFLLEKTESPILGLCCNEWPDIQIE